MEHHRFQSESDAEIALEAMVTSAFIVPQYGRPEVCHGWESQTGYGTREHSRKQYEASPDLGRWSHRRADPRMLIAGTGSESDPMILYFRCEGSVYFLFKQGSKYAHETEYPTTCYEYAAFLCRNVESRRPHRDRSPPR